MDSILFWMIFLQVSIFCIGAILIVSWLVFEPRDAECQRARGRCRPRKARPQPSMLAMAKAETPLEA